MIRIFLSALILFLSIIATSPMETLANQNSSVDVSINSTRGHSARGRRVRGHSARGRSARGRRVHSDRGRNRSSSIGRRSHRTNMGPKRNKVITRRNPHGDKAHFENSDYLTINQFTEIRESSKLDYSCSLKMEDKQGETTVATKQYELGKNVSLNSEVIDGFSFRAGIYDDVSKTQVIWLSFHGNGEFTTLKVPMKQIKEVIWKPYIANDVSAVLYCTVNNLQHID